MIYLCAPIKSGDLDCCKSNKFFNLILEEEYIDLLENRVLSNGDIFTADYVKKNNLIGKKIQLYSPMYCRSHELCKCCYPEFYRYKNPGRNVGLVSANVLGELLSPFRAKSMKAKSK